MALTNEVINQVSEPITQYDNPKEIEQMMLYNLGTGIGIAAVQIGILKRIIIITLKGELITICNPVITKKGKDKKESKEGCLSFPGKTVKKQRWYRVTVQGTSCDDTPILLNLSGMSSFIAQHEIDHLNGIHI